MPGKQRADLRNEMLESAFQPMAEMTPYNETGISALWGAFTASGNTLYVENIIWATGYEQDKDGKKVAYTKTQMGANWSLKSMARQHPLVLETCKKALTSSSLPLPARKIVEEIIREVDKRPR